MLLLLVEWGMGSLAVRGLRVVRLSRLGRDWGVGLSNLTSSSRFRWLCLVSGKSLSTFNIPIALSDPFSFSSSQPSVSPPFQGEPYTVQTSLRHAALKFSHLSCVGAQQV